MANNTIYPYGQGGQLPSSISIADDLNTDSANVALSARQGKILNDSRYFDVDLSGLTEIAGFIIGSNNKWTSTSDSSVIVMLPITPGDTYIITGASGYTSRAAVLMSANLGSASSLAAFATGFSSRIELSNGASTTFEAPANAQALYLVKVNGTGDTVLPSVKCMVAAKPIDNDSHSVYKMRTLIGAGNTYVAEKLTLLPGKYVASGIDVNISKEGVTSSSTASRFAINSYNSSNEATGLVFVATNGSLDPSYDFTVPDDSVYLIIGCRCASGVKFNYNLFPGQSAASGSGDDLLLGTFNSSYNREYDTTEVCKTFSRLIQGKDEIETFLYFSDPHLTPESRYETMTEALRDKYISAIQRHYNSLPLDFCICGGDWLNFYHTPAEACRWLGYSDGYMRKLFRNFYCLVGNHDTNPYYPSNNASSWDNSLSFTTVRNLAFRENGGTYYSFNGINTTFYMLNSGPSFIKEMTDANHPSLVDNRWPQVAWLANKLLTDDAKHSVIFSHIYANGGSEAEWFSTATGYKSNGIHALGANVKALAEAYNARTSITLNGQTYNFANCTGKVALYMCGHTHWDYVDTTGKLPIVSITNLEGGVQTGSTVEYMLVPTFDNCLIDYDNNKLYMVRVGAGVSRIINFYPKEVSAGSTMTLVTELTGTITWTTRDSSVATVSSGEVSGVASGIVGIIATESSGRQEYFIVKVS